MHNNCIDKYKPIMHVVTYSSQKILQQLSEN